LLFGNLFFVYLFFVYSFFFFFFLFFCRLSLIRNRDLEAINSYYEDQYHKQFSLIGDESLVQYCKTMEDFIVFVTRLPNLPLVVQGADDDDDWLRLTQGDLRDKATALKANPTQERLHDLILEILRPFQQQPVHNRHPMANFVKFACHKPGGGYLKVSEIVHLLVHLIHCARLAIFHQLTLHTQEDQREDILQMIRIRFGFFFFFFFPALVFTFLLGLLTISFIFLSFFVYFFLTDRVLHSPIWLDSRPWPRHTTREGMRRPSWSSSATT